MHAQIILIYYNLIKNFSIIACGARHVCHLKFTRNIIPVKGRTTWDRSRWSRIIKSDYNRWFSSGWCGQAVKQEITKLSSNELFSLFSPPSPFFCNECFHSTICDYNNLWFCSTVFTTVPALPVYAADIPVETIGALQTSGWPYHVSLSGRSACFLSPNGEHINWGKSPILTLVDYVYKWVGVQKEYVMRSSKMSLNSNKMKI